MALKVKRSITETPNSLTGDIDLASPIEIVRLLRQADAQIFSGYLTYSGMYDDENIDNLARLAVRAGETLANPSGVVVLSGAGTSGRLAMLGSRAMNLYAPDSSRKPFHYLMAGGDRALLQAQEGAEDDPHQGVADLNAVTRDADDVFYVGITCGFSAPYIAGQLKEMQGRRQGYSVLMGFNPLELARDVAIEGWDETFLSVARTAAATDRATLLNPIVGPEPVTGSTRMKSGTATKILIEVLFHTERLIRGEANKLEAAQELAPQLIRIYETAFRDIYLKAGTIAQLVEAGGETLRSGGHIYYLGAANGGDARDSASADCAILGVIDASECPPTYGAHFEDVRGFLVDGWRALFPEGNVDFSDEAERYRISVADFMASRLTRLKKNDLCVFLGDFDMREDLIERVRITGARTAAISWGEDSPSVEVPLIIQGEYNQKLAWGPLQMQVKLALNALTTGAHVLAGKVFGNRMVDLKISNNKLFHRTVGIISDLMGVSTEDATEALLRSVYQTDQLKDSHREASVRDYIDTAKDTDKVVPKALLIATGRFNYAEATEALKANPVVRAAIEQYVK